MAREGRLILRRSLLLAVKYRERLLRSKAARLLRPGPARHPPFHRAVRERLEHPLRPPHRLGRPPPRRARAALAPPVDAERRRLLLLRLGGLLRLLERCVKRRLDLRLPLLLEEDLRSRSRP